MGARNVQILKGDATKIPLPYESVDVVTSNGVLNLVPDKPAAIVNDVTISAKDIEDQVGAVILRDPDPYLRSYYADPDKETKESRQRAVTLRGAGGDREVPEGVVTGAIAVAVPGAYM